MPSTLLDRIALAIVRAASAGHAARTDATPTVAWPTDGDTHA